MKLFHFISEEHAFDTIRNQRLKLSQINDLNDPFELTAVELSDKEFRHEYKAFKTEMAEKNGILCFSRAWESPLLWSHYANRHKGVALEFEVLDSVALSVVYRTNRYDLNFKKRNGQTPSFEKKDIQGIWLTKYKQWEYEDEVRVILRKTECYKERAMYFYKLGQDIHLKGIVLGPLCSIPVSEIQNCLPKNMRISAIQARLAFRSFSIVKKQSFKKVYLKG